MLVSCGTSELTDDRGDGPAGAVSDDDFRERGGAPEVDVDLGPCEVQRDCPFSNSVCYQDDGPGYCTVPCRTSDECASSAMFCSAGTCLPTCQSGADCPQGYGCEARACVALPEETDPFDGEDDAGGDSDDPGTVGDDDPLVQPPEYTNYAAPCVFNADCDNADANPDVVCLTGIPGGYCTLGCSANAHCGSEARCALEGAPGQFFCGLRCAGDSECGRPTQLACDLAMSDPICVDLASIEPTVDDPPVDDPPADDPPADDPPDDDPFDPSPSARAVGGACAFESDCRLGSLTDNRCFTNEQGWPGGYCTAFGCFTDSDCGSNGFCARGTAPDSIGLCIRTCDTSCPRAGYNCLPRVDGLGGICLPDLPDPLYDEPNVGEPCTITDQCTAGNGDLEDPARICIPPEWPDGEIGIPDGYCSAVNCTPGSGDCGLFGTCVTFPAESPDEVDINLCLADCNTPESYSNCRDGYFCYDVGLSWGVCWLE